MAGNTLLNEERIERIVRAIKVGATYELSAKYAGVSPSTLSRWLRIGRKQDSQGVEPEDDIHCNLWHAVQEAEGYAAYEWLAKIEKAAAEGTWQAAAWKLERRYPDDYGRRPRRDASASTADAVVTVRIGKPDARQSAAEDEDHSDVDERDDE